MPPRELAFPATSSAVLASRIIASPFQFIADDDTFVRVTSVCSVTGVTLAMQGRRLDAAQQLQPIRETHAPNTDRTTKTQDFKVGDGAILNLTVFASAGAPLKGQCYVMVQLLRNFGSTAIVLGTLLAGYVTSAQALGFPGSPIVSSVEGPGNTRHVVGTNPAPGIELNEAVPTGARWRLVHVISALTTNATVAGRVPYLRVTTSNGFFSAYPPAASVPASSSQYVQWATSYTTWVVGGTYAQAASMPGNLLLAAGWSVGTFTENLQAADDWSVPSLCVEEWLEVN